MRLEDFQRTGLREFVRYSTTLTDESGQDGHELLILGTEVRIRSCFADSEFEVTMRPGEGKSVEELRNEPPREWLAEAVDPAGELRPSPEGLRCAFDDPGSWFKSLAPDPTPESSVMMVLYRRASAGESPKSEAAPGLRSARRLRDTGLRVPCDRRASTFRRFPLHDSWPVGEQGERICHANPPCGRTWG
jgi:hypothetical protein